MAERQASPSKLRRFGFSGLSFLCGLVIFSVQQFYQVVGQPPSWIAALAWIAIATGLMVLGVWFWDRSAKQHWTIKIIISVGVVLTLGLMSYGPVKRQYISEHQPSATKSQISTPTPVPANGNHEPVKEADLKAEFVIPKELSLIVRNHSTINAFDPKYEVNLWNLDEARNQSVQTVLGLPIFYRTDRGDFIKPAFGSGPYEVLNLAEASGRVKVGDRLAGYGRVTCSNCSYVRNYWIYYVIGTGGWYSSMPVGQGPQMSAWIRAIPQLARDPESVFSFIPQSKRVSIKGMN